MFLCNFSIDYDVIRRSASRISRAGRQGAKHDPRMDEVRICDSFE